MSYFKTVDEERRARAAAATRAHHNPQRPSETFDWDRAIDGMHKILDAHTRAIRRDQAAAQRQAKP